MANRILANEGIFDYLGHVSVRKTANPDSFFISRALAPDQVTKADFAGQHYRSVGFRAGRKPKYMTEAQSKSIEIIGNGD